MNHPYTLKPGMLKELAQDLPFLRGWCWKAVDFVPEIRVVCLTHCNERVVSALHVPEGLSDERQYDGNATVLSNVVLRQDFVPKFGLPVWVVIVVLHSSGAFFTEPYFDQSRTLIDASHNLYLVGSFSVVLLVDAQGVDPISLDADIISTSSSYRCFANSLQELRLEWRGWLLSQAMTEFQDGRGRRCKNASAKLEVTVTWTPVQII